jgi:hypothetical protein
MLNDVVFLFFLVKKVLLNKLESLYRLLNNQIKKYRIKRTERLKISCLFPIMLVQN